MNTKLLKFVCAIGLLSTMLAAHAAWTISPVSGKNWTHEISDGTWTLGCEMIDENGNFMIGDKGNNSKIVVAGAGNSLDLSTINTDLDTDELDYTLTQFGLCAFEGYSIVDLFIPNTVTEIGGYAFKNSISGVVTFEEDSQLVSIGQQAFYNSKLTYINLDECTQLEVLGSECFRYCSSLTSLGSTGVFQNVKTMNHCVFANATSLTGDYEFPELVLMDGSDHFKPTKITGFKAPKLVEIAGYSFNNCYYLEKVVLSSECKKIGPHAFNNCSALVEINIPSTIEEIGTYALNNCKLLQTIGETDFPVLTFLGDHAFTGTEALAQEFNAPIYEGSTTQTYIFEKSGITKIYMPNLTKAATGTFYNMTNLEELTISEDLEGFPRQFLQNDKKLTTLNPNVFPKATWIGLRAFDSCEILTGDYYFPAVTEIHDHAFVNTKAISSITADAVVYIHPNYNFENCAATNISLKSVMNISYGCFQGAKNLQNLTLNPAITNINDRSFYNSYFERITPTKFYNLEYLGSEAFQGNSVYSGSLDFTGSVAITNIKHHTFTGCTKITEIKLPATITTVDNYALENVKVADIYFYGPRTTNGVGIFKSTGWNTIVVMPEYTDTWTITDESSTFTPLENVSSNQLNNNYPTSGKVLGTITFTTGDNATHWLTEFIPRTTTLIVR